MRKQFVAAMVGGKQSVMDAGELWGSLREAISPAVIASVAEERARHRMLLIGTVNADLGVRRIWNVGLLAQEATRTKDSTRFHEVITASGTVPGAFPPVEIDGYLHIDGGIGSIFSCGINAAWLEYAGAKWRHLYGSTRPLPTIRIWIILNGRLQVAPATVQPGWSTMLARALDISGRVSAQSLLNEMVAGAELMKTRHGWTIEVRYMAIPDTVELPTQESTFDATYMRKLSDVGMQMGADPGSWRSKLMARDYPGAGALQPEPRRVTQEESK